jgi:hypothetical protein
MNEQASTLEHNEAAEPHHNQNYCKDKKHGHFLLSWFKVSHNCVRATLLTESESCSSSLLGMKNKCRLNRF